MSAFEAGRVSAAADDGVESTMQLYETASLTYLKTYHHHHRVACPYCNQTTIPQLIANNMSVFFLKHGVHLLNSGC